MATVNHSSQWQGEDEGETSTNGLDKQRDQTTRNGDDSRDKCTLCRRPRAVEKSASGTGRGSLRGGAAEEELCDFKALMGCIATASPPPGDAAANWEDAWRPGSATHLTGHHKHCCMHASADGADAQRRLRRAGWHWRRAGSAARSG